MDGVRSGGPGNAGWVRRRRWWLAGAGLILIGALAIGVALSWHFSSRVLVPDHSSWLEPVRVEALPPGRIVLERSEETERPGVYGLDWLGGHAIIGQIVDEDEGTVTRRLRSVQGYLAPEMEVGLEANVYAGDPGQALGIPFADVDVPGELGPMPAWSLPGESDTWAIVVHGINGTPQTGLRIVPALRRAGLPALLITYREDLGAPPSPDGLHHMGLTEWRDLAAAARYALTHGARRLVLVGYSMGGAIVAQFMQRSPLAARVASLVLDAPVLDWRRTLEFNTTEMGFPSLAALPLEWAIGARIDADWDSLDALQHSRTSTSRSCSFTAPTTRSCRSRSARTSPPSCPAGSPFTRRRRLATSRPGTWPRDSTNGDSASSSLALQAEPERPWQRRTEADVRLTPATDENLGPGRRALHVEAEVIAKLVGADLFGDHCI